jgi:isoleucyl-tRNA synthetase
VSDFDGSKVNLDTIQSEIDAISKTSLEGYLLSKTSELIDTVETSYKSFKFKNAHTEIYNFCNDTLSAFYCAAVKDRLYCDAKDSPRRRQAQLAMWTVLEVLARLLAPILPHTADELYQALHNNTETSVHLQSWLTFKAETASEWNTVLETREAVLKALEEAKSSGIENNLDAGVRLSENLDTLETFKDDLPDMFGVSQVHFDTQANGVVVEDLKNEPRCERSWKRDGTVKQRSNNALLSDRDAIALGVA